MNLTADDPELQRRVTALVQGLQQLGWIDGRNVRIDTRWGAGDTDRYRRYAAELVALAPDVILAPTAAVAAQLRQATRAVPIVFVQVIDPVAAGLVESLARPGGNVTGFMQFEYGMSGKLLELLKQVAPRLVRAGVTRDPSDTSGIGQFAAIQAVAPSLGVVLSPITIRDAGEIERMITTFAHGSNYGLIVPGSSLATLHRELIIKLAAHHRLPAVYRTPSSSPQAAYFLTGLIVWTTTDKRPAMSIASSTAKNRLICQFKHRLSTSLPSTSRPPRRSVSRFRQCCSPAPTR